MVTLLRSNINDNGAIFSNAQMTQQIILIHVQSSPSIAKVECLLSQSYWKQRNIS